ncbi:abnormal spindle-like microcephaly-associated protein [Pholidichthys leucotaenia]
MAETAGVSLRGFLDFSPVRSDVANKENEVPVLTLIQFSKAPFVTFGSVKVGAAKSAVLRIENPTDDVEAEVTVDKIPAAKGFSVDCETFTIQPGGSFSLMVTWTPSEEGGVRELLMFSANGILKHQAILLGRAEATKKKKKSLWDSIKNKKGDKVTTPRRRKMEPSMKMAANKTFHVSRQNQYKRDKPRSPLASLNGTGDVRGASLTTHSPSNDRFLKSEEQKTSDPRQGQQSLVFSHQENIRHNDGSSPVVLLVPTGKVIDSDCTSTSPEIAGKSESKDRAKMLNRTLSPIGTPEQFKKLIPHIRSESPFPSTVKSVAAAYTDSVVSRSPSLSLKDALALIDSDLSHANNSPQGINSSCSFSDSLESNSSRHHCGPDADVLKVLSNSPELAESSEPRLTFFVCKKDPISVSEVPERVKKYSFNSSTVTKSKAAQEEHGGSGRKIKKSRRRLLEKTLELSESSSQSESGPGTPNLPVIDSDSGPSPCEGRRTAKETASSSPVQRLHSPLVPIAFPVSSPPPLASRFSFSITSPPSAVPVAFTVTSPCPVGPSSYHRDDFSSSDVLEQQVPPCAQDEMFPIHLVAKSKKRKSEEFLKSDGKVDGVGKTDQVKRSRVLAGKTEPSRLAPGRRGASQRTAGSGRPLVTPTLKTVRSVVPGQAKQPSSKTISRGTTSMRVAGAPSVKMAKVVPVAQSKLTFIKPPPMALPRHPMPFAAKNMFYDERWIEKQERGFTWWINYVLTPDDFKVNPEMPKVNAVSLAMGSDIKSSVPKAPTKEEMSFSTYTARRKLNRLRRSACQLFTSGAMVKAIQRLELEVEARRLLIRKDRYLWKDIGERKKILNWLLSYNSLWLRIGLETIFGELISLESNSDTLGLAMFILQRLLWNPDIAAEFRHPRVPHLYKDGHEEVLSRFTLKKLLLLVCFLDRAKESRLIEHDPCLFCVDAEFKSSKDLLLAFSRDFLSGEGILPRHLSYLGLSVSHIQTPLDEFDFAVKNLAVDLRCGIRLVHVMELLIQNWSLSAKLRLPAISRLQKIHNVDVALQVLKCKGVDLKDEHGSTIDSRDVVDGHREKTLSLLWKIIFAFHVEVILDEDQLREEIEFLTKTLKIKRRLEFLRADRAPQPSPTKSRAPYDHSSTKVILLMDWVRAVCDFYGLKVENFTVTFSDGRVLCYLIHHYHPGLLPAASISHSTTQTVECSPRGRLELGCSASDSDSSLDSLPEGLNDPASPPPEFKELLENEKNNFRLVNSAVAFLGGVPAMINSADMSNTIPSERVVMPYLSFLCARLLDLRNETRAARAIQVAWRKYKLKKDLQLFKERNGAAVKIQVVVRCFLQKQRSRRQNLAVIIIQSFWRGYVVRKRLRMEKEAQLLAMQHEAATVIQAQWRMLSAMKTYQCLRYYTIVVQAQWRMRTAVSAYGKLCWGAIVIQKYWRACALSRRDRECYLSLRSAVVKIQRGYRRWKAQKTHKENCAAKVIQAAFRKWYKERLAQRSAAAVKIQSWYRMQMSVHQYIKIKTSVLLIQRLCRGYSQRHRFQTLKMQHHSAVIIQSAFRGHIVRKKIAKMRCAAVVIQHWFRASLARDVERKMLVTMRCAAVTIQAAYRGKVAREILKKQHRAAILIQATWRKYATRRHYLALKRAAVVIQQKYRATTLARETKNEYDALRNAVLTIQANWRGRVDRKKIEKWHQCATEIQAHYRQYRAHAEYKSKKAAAKVIQYRYRAYVAGMKMRKAYLEKRAACIILQAVFRGMKVRAEMEKKHQAVTTIQSFVRMFLCRKRYFLHQSAVIIIQSRYRASLLCRIQQREYRQLRKATIKIQAGFRGFRVRQVLQRRHNAATAIQAQFRMYKTRAAYLATKCAAIMIQERYRAKKLKDQQMQRYKSMKSTTIVIQAAYRGHRTRRELVKMHQAAMVIQRMFKTVRERKKFLAVKAAALTCQQRYRAITLVRKDRLEYLSKYRAVICLQAAYRGYKARKQLRIEHMAAVIIQSHFRRYRQTNIYQRLRWASSILQTRYRAIKKMRAEMHALSCKKSAAVILQAAFRGMQSRRIIRRRHQAATVIQSIYRTYCEHRYYLTLKSSVLLVQRRYRSKAVAQKQKQQYVQLRRAAINLQAAYRGQKIRKGVARWHQAATVIQSAFRRHREEVKYQAMRLSAIIIQRRYCAHALQKRDREKFKKIRHSVIVIQAGFRGHRVRMDIAKMHEAANVIQASFKRHQQQSTFRRQRWAACVLQQRFRAQKQRDVDVKHYQDIRKAAIVLQAVYRGVKSRKIIRERHQAASVIQRAYRAHCERQQYVTFKLAVLFIQRKYRATIAAKAQRTKYLKMCRAAVFVQSVYRGKRTRREVACWHEAATVIQSAFRKHREEVKYQAMRLSAIVIQRCYRAHALQKQDREKFLKIRQSVLILQATFRGHCVRMDIAKMHRAATIIQANFKRHQKQSDFWRQRWAACVFQQRFRAQKQRDVEFKHYQNLRKAAIMLQAAYRGMKSRKIIRERHEAASVIQQAYRAHCEYRRYTSLKSAILTIQRRYQATVAAKRHMQDYQEMRRAAVLFQAAYRGHQTRKVVARCHQAATVIQCAFRKHREVKYQAMRLSAIIIQRHYRAYALQKWDREKFLEIRSFVIVLQAAFRGHCVRSSIKKMHRAATVIQARFRRHQQQSAFRRQRWAACVLQQRFRAQKQRDVEVKHYQDIRKATIVLQAAYRGMKSRTIIRERHQAASVIQRAYRAHCERQQYLTFKLAILYIQRKYRATIAAKAQRTKYLKMCRAAVFVQSVYRGKRTRREVACWHEAATVIQSAFRKHREEVKYQAMRLSAIVIQRCYRAHALQKQDREKFLKIRQSVLILQATFRGHCVRMDIAKMHRAATIIQANFKRHQKQSDFWRQRWAACVFQQRFRAQKQRDVEFKRYQNLRKAAIMLQTAYRGMKSRKIIRERHEAASVFQQAYRAHCEYRRYTSLKSAILTIQRRYRATVAAKKHMQDYQEMRRAAVLFQAAYRGHQTRKVVARCHQAATVIQCAFRKHREEVKYQAMRLSAIIIQRHYRAYALQKRDREKFLEIRNSVIALQAAFRGHCVRSSIKKMHRAATVIQARFRRHQQQSAFRRQRWAACVLQQRFRAQKQRDVEVKHYQNVRKATIVLQAAYRGMTSRTIIRERHQAASVIQRAYRAHCERQQYLTFKLAILIIQRKYRAAIAAKAQRTEYLEMCRAAVFIQALYRGHQTRKKVACWHQAATVIQSAFRKHREKVRYQSMRLSAIIIQQRYRAHALQQQEREKFLKMKQSAIVLQTAFRGWCVRRDISQKNQAALVIQSCWRCLVQRRDFQMKREATVLLQRWVRAVQLGRKQRNKYNQIWQATITLQKYCRAWISRQKVLEAVQAERRIRFTSAVFHHLSAIKIQRALRAHWALELAKKQIHSVVTIQRWVRAKQQRKQYLEDKTKVTIVQRAVRSWLARRHKAASIIQQTVRKFLLRRRQNRIQQGIVKAQALWRGHISRRLHDDAKVIKLRHRLQKISANVREEDKLCNKTSSALDYLLQYKHFSYILEALKNLETTTRLSPECCERLVESGATNVIFTLIRCCNRSIPCMDVITFSIQILLNLSKYHKTIEAVYLGENSVETLLDLLQRYREKAGDKVPDKGGNIFTKACFLLALLLQDKHRAQEVMRLPKVLDRIQSIYRLTARKNKMDAERSIIKQKMNASVNGSFRIPPTPRKSRAAPKFAPDWVLRKDKLKDIVDPLRAIKMVADAMSIVL